jgi:hypothetical protein
MIDTYSILESIQTLLVGLTVPDATSDTPAWLPAGALAFAHFVDGHSYAGGSEATLEAEFIPDPNATQPSGDPLGFTPPFLVDDDGLAMGADYYNILNPAGAIFADIIANPRARTYVIEWVPTAGFEGDLAGELMNFTVGLPHSGDGHYVEVGSGDLGDHVTRAYASDSNGEYPRFLSVVVMDQVNKVAFTLSDIGVSASFNGVAVQVSNSEVIETDFQKIHIGRDNDDFIPTTGRVRSITIYPAQLDADLPALSALT